MIEERTTINYSIMEDYQVFWISVKNMLHKITFVDIILRTIVKLVSTLTKLVVDI